MNDSLSARAAQARAEQLAAEAAARTAAEQAAELRRQRELQELQNIPSAHEARKAASKWFSAMGVEPVETQVTGHQYDRNAYNDEGYLEVRAEWYSTFLTWQLEGHSYYADYREYSILDERPCKTSAFTVEIAIRTSDDKTIRRRAHTLAELGAALEEE